MTPNQQSTVNESPAVKPSNKNKLASMFGAKAVATTPGAIAAMTPNQQSTVNESPAVKPSNKNKLASMFGAKAVATTPGAIAALTQIRDNANYNKFTKNIQVLNVNILKTKREIKYLEKQMLKNLTNIIAQNKNKLLKKTQNKQNLNLKMKKLIEEISAIEAKISTNSQKNVKNAQTMQINLNRKKANLEIKMKNIQNRKQIAKSYKNSF